MSKESLLDPVVISNFKEKAAKEGCSDELTCVFYTDGGGCTNMTLGSYGLHGVVIGSMAMKTGLGAGIKGYSLTNVGYILNESVHKNVSMFRRGEPVLGGDLFVKPDIDATPLFYIDMLGAIQQSTNNVGEGTAVLRGLQLAKRLYVENNIRRFHFVSDSQYVLTILTNIEKYEANGWMKQNGEPIANIQMWKDIVTALDELKQPELDITYQWAKGHSDNLGNIIADSLASKGLVAARNGANLEESTVLIAKGYWSKTNSNQHPLHIDVTWYYNPKLDLPKSTDGLNLFYIGTHGESERWGQPNPKDTFGIVGLKDIPEALLALKEAALKVEDTDSGFGFDGVFYSDLNKAMQVSTEEDLIKAPDVFLRFSKAKSMISNVKKIPIATKFSPARLSIITLDRVYTDLEDKFKTVNEYLKGINTILPIGWNIKEITDDFFETKTTKNKTTKVFKRGTDTDVDIDAEVKYVDKELNAKQTTVRFNLSFGITAPPRRTFNNMKERDPRFFILTIYEPESTVRYYTAMLTGDGEVGLWGNHHANIVTFFPT